MRKSTLQASAALFVGGWLAVVGPPARGEDRPADQIVAEINAAQPPTFDPALRNDSKALAEFLGARQKVQARRSELIRELYRSHPDNPKLPALLNERWQALMSASGGLPNPELTAELGEVLAHSKNETLRADAAYWKAVAAFRASRGDFEGLVAKIDDFIKVAPRDDRAAMLLYAVANQMQDADKQTALFKRIKADYPDSRPAKMVEGNLKRLEGIGKPFALDFKDAIKGSPVSIKELKGKVVVIDFWATWCGPCVAELPKMLDLYAKYHAQGVEFIGVSLDQPKEQGGLDKLKEFVAKREVPWPQYYQGNGWESDFSSSWGINSIPALFLVDQDGNLASVNARQNLEEEIKKLLKATGPKGDGN